MSTITKHMQTWRSNNQLSLENSVEVSSTFQLAAKKELIRAVQDERQMMATRIAGLEADMSDLQNESERLQAENVHLQEINRALGSERDHANGKTTQLESDVAQLVEKLEIANKAAEAARSNEEKEKYASTSLKQQIEKLESALHKTCTDLQNVDTQRIEASKQAAILEAKLSAAEDAAKKGETRVSGLEEQLAKVSANLQTVQADLTATLRQHQDVLSRAERAERDASDFRAQLIHMGKLTSHTQSAYSGDRDR